MKRVVLVKGCAIAMLLMLVASVPAFAAPEPPPHAVVLIYHHFGVDRYPTTNITMARFKAQLDYLEKNHYHVWSLGRIVDAIWQGKPIPDHTVAITIDDAYESVYMHAFPLLEKHGWPFTVFVATGYIDRGYHAFMTWAQMREMQKHGASFENHSDSHGHLALPRKGESEAAWHKRVRADIARAQRRLKQEFGAAPRFFSYPYGEYSGALADIVQRMGLIGVGQESGAVGINSDLRVIPRFPMAGRYADMAQFRTKVASLPLPVISQTPWEMVTGDARPELELTLTPDDDVRLDGLRCYAGDGRGIDLSAVAGAKDRFFVREMRPLPVGRSRYNCTAPSRSSGRFYWFSHPWLYLSPGFVVPPE